MNKIVDTAIYRRGVLRII